jgi:hypothetical protein
MQKLVEGIHHLQKEVFSSKRRWRGRAAGERLALVVSATACLCLGCEPRVEIVDSPESGPAEPLRAEERGERVEAVPLARQWVRVEGVDRPIADYYHERTKLSPLGVGQQAPLRSPRPPGVFKPYPDAATFPLPEHRGRVGVATGEAIDRSRRPLSGFRSEGVSLEELATLLHATNGITASVGTGGGAHFLRAAPSAGALYPTVTYVVARDVSGLPAGLYHFAVNRGEPAGVVALN